MNRIQKLAFNAGKRLLNFSAKAHIATTSAMGFFGFDNPFSKFKLGNFLP